MIFEGTRFKRSRPGKQASLFFVSSTGTRSRTAAYAAGRGSKLPNDGKIYATATDITEETAREAELEPAGATQQSCGPRA